MVLGIFNKNPANTIKFISSFNVSKTYPSINCLFLKVTVEISCFFALAKTLAAGLLDKTKSIFMLLAVKNT